MVDERASFSLRFLYTTVPGRVLLKVITNPVISRIGGVYLSSRISSCHIAGFIKKNNIDMSEYVLTKYGCFNDFFTRKVCAHNRPIDMDPNSLISPCDGRLTVYKITENSAFDIKGSSYSVADLVRSRRLAKEYTNGLCLVFRLCVDDYHRYCYVDSGKKNGNIYIKGKLHTVQPIALRSYPVYVQNCREYTVIKSRNFGMITQLEVGAMLVGKINNYHGKRSVLRGQEKGMFLFGGSTIVILLQENKAVIDKEILMESKKGREVVVKMGQRIGLKHKQHK